MKKCISRIIISLSFVLFASCDHYKISSTLSEDKILEEKMQDMNFEHLGEAPNIFLVIKEKVYLLDGEKISDSELSGKLEKKLKGQKPSVIQVTGYDSAGKKRTEYAMKIVFELGFDHIEIVTPRE